MKKLLCSIMLFVLTLSGFAETLDVDITKLNPSDLQAYQKMKQMQQEQQQSFSMDSITPQKIDQYSQIGKAFGSAFKECWTTVSSDAEKFAQSDAGKWAMVLVSWKIMGQDAIGLTRTVVQWIVGAFLMIIGIPFFIWVFRRNCVLAPIQVVERTGFWQKKVIYRNTDPIHAEVAIVYGFVFFAYIGLVCAVTFIH